jgi:transposase-like protein
MVRGIISVPLNIPSEIPGFKRLNKCLTEGCDGYLRHIERTDQKSKKGKTSFFSCSVCHKTFNDVDGIPVQKKENKETDGVIVEAPCPLGCGGSARRFEGKYGYFWKCRCSPDETFRDMDGSPAIKEKRVEAKCPVTGCKGKAMRLTGKKDGRLFWLCHVCGNFFDDAGGVPTPRKTHPKSGKRREVAGV